MLEWINIRPFQMVLFFTLISFFTICILWNLKNPKRLFFLLIFYIPLSFRTSSGTLGMYLVLSLYILFLNYRDKDSEINRLTADTILIVSILLATTFSILTTEHTSFFVLLDGRLRISYKYLYIITMGSNLAIYFLCKKFIVSKNDLVNTLKYLVISGTIASLAAYLQLIDRGLFVFKYIVLAENPKWSTRVAGTMQGYELLAEYTAILIVFSFLLLLLSTKKLHRIVYLVVISNFVIILTLTQTRGIYIAVVLSALYLISLFFLTGKFKTIIKFITVFVAILIFSIGSLFIIDQLRPDSSFVERFDKLAEIDIKKGQFDTRSGVWKLGTQRINNMSSMEKIFGAGYKYLFRGEQGSVYQGWPHCLYFTYILRDGFVGFALLLIFFAWLYKASIIGIVRDRYLHDKELFLISIAFHLVLIIFIVDQAKIEFIRHDRTQNIYWLMFGLISVLSTLVKKDILKK